MIQQYRSAEEKRIDEQIKAIHIHSERVRAQPIEWIKQYCKYLSGEAEAPEWPEQHQFKATPQVTEEEIRKAAKDFMKVFEGFPNAQDHWLACVKWLQSTSPIK